MRLGLFLAFLTLYAAGSFAAEEAELPTAGPVLMVVASEGFRDEEYAHPRAVLEGKGFAVKVASTTSAFATGVLGAKIKIDLLLTEVKPEDFRGIIFVGGPGATQYFKDPTALALARNFFEKNKPVAAICIAPQILANAGILKEKRATAFSSVKEGLRSAGANFTASPVEVDGNIITASGPTEAKLFGEAIAGMLTEKQEAEKD